MIKISIIVPVYNVEKYLSECLDSLLNQTLKEIEIILVDDESTDQSPIICNQYAEKDSSLVIAIKDKETDGYIIELNEPTLSNEIMHLNQEEISNYSWEEVVASNTLKDEDDNNTFAEAYSRQLDMIFG